MNTAWKIIVSLLPSGSIRLLKTLSNATYTTQYNRIELKYNAIQYNKPTVQQYKSSTYPYITYGL